MKHILCVSILLCLQVFAIAQSAINMVAQPNYTYTENFIDIANWAFNASGDGTLNAGTGAGAWKGYAGPAGSGTIPNGTKIVGSTNTFQLSSSTSSGVYKLNQALGLLTTGTSDNTTAIAFDLFINFTALNAGTLSFDWASVNNLAGNRSSSLKIYTSTDGVNFTELPSAAVTNITNNAPTSGHVNFVSLPASLNGAANAQIRFYLYNGTGGTSGSRPKLSIDNVSVTAVPATVCTTPSAQPTSLNLSPAYSSISGTFTAATPAADNYLVVRSLNNNLSALPVNGTNYNIGDNLGDGVVTSTTGTTFSSTSLSPATQYYFFIFAMNNLCSGGTKYLTANPLTATVSTLSGSAPCTTPANQPTNLALSNITLSSVKGTFTASTSVNADHYLVVRSTNSSLSSNPVNGVNYSTGANIGGGVVVTKTQQTSFTANGLTSGTQYYFFVFAVSEDNCIGGPVYNTASPLTGNATTTVVPVCAAPGAQPTALQASVSDTYISGFFTASTNTDGYVVVLSTSSTLSATPLNGTTYAVGSTLGGGTVIANSAATSFIATGLNTSTTYYVHIFSKNDQCSGGPLYLTANPLQGNGTTTSVAALRYYFGNLHAHSSYSDGNKDNPGYTPANDYAYAKTSLCMDFLGISEHNHNEAGMQLSNWLPGRTQAAAATNTNFLALYGMEWGVISNGGHVLVYGIDQLIGWEPNNYNIYVGKSDYTGKPSTTGTTGLFKTINDWPATAFAMLAHPDNSDYNGIANAGLNPTADSAIAGCALESGPAFSTSINYDDAPTRLSYYNYYKQLLSRGYHTGPSIDHDTHYTNFGRSNYSRLAVLSPTLTESDFLQSVKQRRFYATHDCDTRVVFTLNNSVMGSIINGTTAPAISIHVTDPTNPSATATIRLMQGVAGSGLLPVAIDSAVNTNYFNYTDNSIQTNTQTYYYAEISISGGNVITSPIWYTKSGTVTPVTLLSFTGLATPERTVKLNWRTVNEINNKQFIIEHAADGVSFTAFDSVAGRNQSTENNYTAVDKTPVAGFNYYRLKQVDTDGKFMYSNVVAVRIGFNNNKISVLPNPVKNVAIVSIKTEEKITAQFQLVDGFGRSIRQFPLQLEKGEQLKQLDVADLPGGTYYIILNTPAGKVVSRFVKL
jgi:hypothetical protein